MSGFYKIVGGEVLLSRDGILYTEKKDIYIGDGVILALIEQGEPAPLGDFESFNAEGMLVMPGLINMHTHAYMNLMRNFADDVPFNTWLFDRIDPAEGRIRPEDAYYSTLFAITEMIESGTTSFVDMHMFCAQSARAATDCGMRAFIGRGLVGDDIFGDGKSRFLEALSEMEEYSSPLVKFNLAPHAIYTCTPKLLSQIASEAEERGLLKNIHLAESDFEQEYSMREFGKSPTKLLYDIGFLDKNTILAHCVKLSDSDISLIAKSGASAVTNPASNAKLGNGIAPVSKMQSAGINVALGTDGVASNNTLNMFREMGLLSLLHKANSADCMALPSSEVLMMATENAARALGCEGTLGKIAPGAAADLAFVDLSSTSLLPNNNSVSSLCYSANGSEVDSLMVGGKFLMKKRELLTIDKEKVYFEVAASAKRCL